MSAVSPYVGLQGPTINSSQSHVLLNQFSCIAFDFLVRTETGNDSSIFPQASRPMSMSKCSIRLINGELDASKQSVLIKVILTLNLRQAAASRSSRRVDVLLDFSRRWKTHSRIKSIYYFIWLSVVVLALISRHYAFSWPKKQTLTNGLESLEPFQDLFSAGFRARLI